MRFFESRATKIHRLKYEARMALVRFRAEAEKYDCGAALLKEINPAAAKAAEDYNTAVSQLMALDPKCPRCEPL